MSYIKKEALLEHKRKMKGFDLCDEFWCEAVLCEDIRNAPAADVVEVRHGENITKNHPVDEFICSECGLIMRDCCRYEIDEDTDPPDENCYEFKFRYCPRCGIKIDD